MVCNWTRKAATLAAVLLAACGGGGGGGPTAVPGTEPEAVVVSVADAQVLEGAAGTTELVFTVTLNKASLSGNRLIWSTASTLKAGGGATSNATGGATCGGAVDYITMPLTTLLIPRGDTTGQIRVAVCGDAGFEANESLAVNWTSDGLAGTATGTILNDDAGGLNGTGVAAAFGRDGNPLTNSSTDGRLGFSFANVAGAGGVQCIRDNVTGLLWEGKTGANAATQFATYADLTAHVDAVKAASLCGFNDWRLPTPEELASLVDNGVAAAPTADATWLAGQQAGRYWTSTTYLDATNLNAWFVDFSTGTVSWDAKANFPAPRQYFARLVTGGGLTPAVPAPATCADASPFTVHGDATVTDKRTGLMWKQCPEGLSGAACTTGTPAAVAWDAALLRPAATNADSSTNQGYSDWRLPTRAELSSIAEREQCPINQASINTTVFPNTGLVDYWTSTPDALSALLAWRVNFSDGEVGPAFKTGASSAKRIRLVRAGQ